MASGDCRSLRPKKNLRMTDDKEHPAVSVVVVNFNGRHHLEDCFRSLLDVDYPRERLELICVDNASSDDSVEFLREKFPDVKIVDVERNSGFASGCNIGARTAQGEFVAFLNNDMRVDPGWVRGLLAPIDRDSGVICSAGKILTWTGEQVDFLLGAATFSGFGIQVGSQVLADLAPSISGPMLFACGGSMLVDRFVYLEAGGFDDDFFAFFEDVDFGWRLWLYGFEVAAAPDAVCYHRIHSTTRSVPHFRLKRYYERNALLSLLKNVEEDNLGRLLAAALLLSVRRTMLESGIGPEAYEMWTENADGSEKMPRDSIALLVAIDEVAAQLPKWFQKRAEIQSRRKRSDAEVFSHFSRPFQPVSRVDGYLRTQAELIRLFGLDELHQERHVAMVLVIAQTDERFRANWEPRGISWARGLAGSFEVTFTSEEDVVEQYGLRHIDCDADVERLKQLSDYHEIVFVHAGLFATCELSLRPLLVVDLSGVNDDVATEDWLLRAVQSADGFTVGHREAEQWRERLRKHGRIEAPVYEISDELGIASLHEICRNPKQLRASRGPARLRRLTYDMQVLIDNWEPQLHSLRALIKERDAQINTLSGEYAAVAGEYETAVKVIDRLQNHFVMRTYVRLRRLIPYRRTRNGGE